MCMLKMDLLDVMGYIFLINGKMFEQNWIGMFKLNEKVWLCLINVLVMFFFDICIFYLKMIVVSVDG